jgi:hypothetical protein
MVRFRWFALCLGLLVIAHPESATAGRSRKGKRSENELRTPWGFSCIERAGVKVSARESPPIYVSEIYPSTPASISGLRVGDVLLYVNGVPIDGLESGTCQEFCV